MTPAPQADATSALLAEILNHPEDDALRMVYADWLSERGDPRGELIVLQIALARPVIGARAFVYRYGGEEREDELDALEERIRKLLSKHQADWLAPFRKVIRTWQWRRGFADVFEADAKTFLAGATTLMRHTPVAELQLTAMKPGMVAMLCERPELVPMLERFTSLDISRQRLGPADMVPLATAPLRALENLELWGNPLGDAGVATLLASPHLTKLRQLGLYKCGLTKASLVALSTATCLPTLEVLDLNGLKGCDAEIASLLGRGANLRDLSLGQGELTDELLEGIAAQPAFAKLATLHLPRCDAPSHTPRGARLLLDSPYLRAIERITGLFEHDSHGPLGEQGALAAEFRARFGENAL